MCELACQIIQKKQKEKQIEEEQAASARYWKIPACFDDDEDYDSAITPILSTDEPVDSLSKRKPRKGQNRDKTGQKREALLHLPGSQLMLKSSYKVKDGVIISIPSLVGGVADVVVEIKGT
nr:hypothetical protein [Tanacetum cinerariifolium]